MADLFQNLDTADSDFVAMVAGVLERRAADPAQRAILESCLADLAVADAARVIELGCGTGPVARRFAELDAVAAVHGVDPAPGMIEHARGLARGIDGLSFAVARGECTGEPSESYDIVVLYTVLSHVADPAGLLAEARRLLKPDGQLAICDSDFSQATAATGAADPLQACIEAWRAQAAANPWLVPGLPGLLKDAGFAIETLRGHHRIDMTGISSAVDWIDFGVRTLCEQGRIGEELGEALKAEARRRIAAGSFHAAIPFVSIVARPLA